MMWEQCDSVDNGGKRTWKVEKSCRNTRDVFDKVSLFESKRERALYKSFPQENVITFFSSFIYLSLCPVSLITPASTKIVGLFAKCAFVPYPDARHGWKRTWSHKPYKNITSLDSIKKITSDARSTETFESYKSKHPLPPGSRERSTFTLISRY